MVDKKFVVVRQTQGNLPVDFTFQSKRLIFFQDLHHYSKSKGSCLVHVTWHMSYNNVCNKGTIKEAGGENDMWMTCRNWTINSSNCSWRYDRRIIGRLVSSHQEIK